MSNFLNILMEAKNNKKPPAYKFAQAEDDKDVTDYTAEELEAEFTPDEEEVEGETEATPEDLEATFDPEGDLNETEGEATPDSDNDLNEPNETGQQTDNEDSTDYMNDISNETPDQGGIDETTPDVNDGEGDDNPPMDEGTDYTADGEAGDTGTEEGGGDTPGEEVISSDLDNKGQSTNGTSSEYILKNNIMDIYDFIDGTIEKLNNLLTEDSLLNTIIETSKRNLEKLKDYVFQYIKFDMNKSDYINNLKMYNKFIAVLKINVKILGYLGEDFSYEKNKK